MPTFFYNNTPASQLFKKCWHTKTIYWSTINLCPILTVKCRRDLVISLMMQFSNYSVKLLHKNTHLTHSSIRLIVPKGHSSLFEITKRLLLDLNASLCRTALESLIVMSTGMGDTPAAAIKMHRKITKTCRWIIFVFCTNLFIWSFE